MTGRGVERLQPSVIGRPLDIAEGMLREAGVTAVSVRRSQPPRGGPGGPLRVIRQREAAQGVELVVAASVPLPETEESHD